MTASFRQHLTHKPFAVIGHRGAAGLAPENTLASFEAALACACAAVELDVFASQWRDGSTELLVIHDDELDRTTNGSGLISSFGVEYLRSLDAGAGEKIPLLREVVGLLLRHRTEHGQTVGLNIELKGPGTATPTARMLDAFDAIPVLVSSFDHHELFLFREQCPACEVAPLFSRYTSNWHDIARNLQAVAINISRKIATPERVASMRGAGYAVLVYTVNDLREGERLKAMGVSGVFTDRPDLLTPLARD